MRKIYNKGFALVEAIILLSVVTILSTMVTPNIITFLQFYESRAEEETLYEIKKSLKSYADDWGKLPEEANWFDDILPYTDLSANQIQFDIWNNVRQYRKFTYLYDDLSFGGSFRGQELTADYALVMSYGSDQLVDANTVLNDGGINDIDPLTPDAVLGDITAFGDDDISRDIYANLSMAGNDLIIVYTNLPQMVKNIKITQNRINTIKAAVEGYSSSKRRTDPSQTDLLYRPPTAVIPATPADNIANYDADMAADVDAFLGAGVARFNTIQSGVVAQVNIRRDGMIALVRFLGLTDSYCCNALERYDDGDPTTPDLEVPFFYYSNPRGTDVVVNNCNAIRPGGTGPVDNINLTGGGNDLPFLPVRIMRDQGEVVGDADNCG